MKSHTTQKLHDRIREMINLKTRSFADSERKFKSLQELNVALQPIAGKIATQIRLPEIEAIFFSYTMVKSICGKSLAISELCQFYNLPIFLMPDVLESMNNLANRGYVVGKVENEFGFDGSFWVPNIVMHSFLDLPKTRKGEDLKVCIKRLSKTLEEACSSPAIFKYHGNQMLEEFRSIDNLELKELLANELSGDASCYLFMLVAGKAIKDHQFDELNLDLMDELNELTGDNLHLRDFVNGKGILFASGLVEKILSKQSESFEYILGKKGLELVFGKKLTTIISLSDKSSTVGKVIDPSEIVPTKLFYGNETAEKIETLTQLLTVDGYDAFHSRMKSTCSRQGLNCLLHGSPGTGKTEIVMQLAKKTGRKIFKVDISNIRSKWIGESENNTRKIFNEYYALCKKEKIKPILLFNEADALIGKRHDSNSSADTILNSMQNILLEELENFEGILFATTNLTGNMDMAFDRRFLFKILFKNPTEDIRLKIINDRLPMIDARTAKQMSSQYELSGGDLENVARKIQIHYLLVGQYPNVVQTLTFCQEEKILRKGATIEIGFRSQNNIEDSEKAA